MKILHRLLKAMAFVGNLLQWALTSTVNAICVGLSVKH